MRSNKPQAIQFQKWICMEVLPTMRQLGFNNSLNILKEENMRLQEENNNLRFHNDILRENIIDMKIELEDIYNKNI